MILSIIHLSDIHFKVSANSVIGKLDKIANVITGETQGSDAIISISTGDIAHSGKPEEYRIASEFFTRLETLVKEKTSLSLSCYFLPGNHDCNFDRNTKVRDNLLSGNNSVFIDLTHDDKSILNSCMLHQDFFEFVKNCSHDKVLIVDYDRLHYKYDLAIKDKKVRLHFFNTAWLSRRRDNQGKLFFPVDQIKPDDTKCDLIISAFHHPYSWLEAENSREFRKRVEGLSDVVLTGHEHEAEVYEKIVKSTGDRSRFVEGAVLQTDEKWQSGFNVVNIDIANGKWKYSEFRWAEQKQRYEREMKTEWETFVRSTNLKEQEFEPAPEFAKFLSGAGAGFTHPQAVTVNLDDVFVFPDVDVRPFEGESENIVHGDSFTKYILKHSRLFLTGSERSGKTEVAPFVWTEFLDS